MNSQNPTGRKRNPHGKCTKMWTGTSLVWIWNVLSRHLCLDIWVPQLVELVWWRKAFEGEGGEHREQEVRQLVMTYQQKRKKHQPIGNCTQDRAWQPVHCHSHTEFHAGLWEEMCPCTDYYICMGFLVLPLRDPRRRDSAGQQAHTVPRSWLLNIITSLPREVDDA